MKIVEGLLNSARGELNQTQEGPPLEGKDAASRRSKSQLYLSPALSFPHFSALSEETCHRCLWLSLQIMIYQSEDP